MQIACQNLCRASPCRGIPPYPMPVLFFGAKKRTKRNIHPSKASPQGEDANPGFGKTQIHATFWQAGTSAFIA